MHDVAVAVAEYLDLDMARALDVFLHQHPVVAEGGPGFAPGRGQRVGELLSVAHDAHALAAAAGRGFQQHRPADLRRLAQQFRGLLVPAVIAGHDRHAGLLHDRLGRRLVAHGADGGRRWADEDNAGIGASLREIRVLGQETVTRMDGFGAGFFRNRNNCLKFEITFSGRRGADQAGLVGLAHMQGVTVGLGIDGDRAHAHPFRGADNPTGDLPAIGDQDRTEHQRAFVGWRESPPPCPAPSRGRGIWYE